jgi:hypothetical protein
MSNKKEERFFQNFMLEKRNINFDNSKGKNDDEN